MSTVVDSEWFGNYYNGMGKTVGPVWLYYWIARFSRRELFFDSLFLLEAIGAVLGSLAGWRIRRGRLRGFGVAMSGLYLSILLGLLTFAAFAFIEMTDFHPGP